MDRRRTPRERRRVAAGSVGAVVSIALLVGASPAAADSTWPVPIPRPPVPRTFTPPHLGTPSATPHTGTAQPTPQTNTPGNSSTPRRPRLTPSTAPGVTTLPSTQPTAPVPTPPPSEPSGAPTLTITPTSEPTGDGTVSVLALDSDTGQPVRGAALYVTDRNGRRTIVTPSSITVPAGEVTITASDAPGGYRYEGSLFRSGLVEPGKISSFTFQLRRKPVGGGSINAVARNRVTGAAAARGCVHRRDVHRRLHGRCVHRSRRHRSPDGAARGMLFGDRNRNTDGIRRRGRHAADDRRERQDCHGDRVRPSDPLPCGPRSHPPSSREIHSDRPWRVIVHHSGERPRR